MIRALSIVMCAGLLAGCTANARMSDLFATKELHQPDKSVSEDVRSMAATQVFIETDRNVLGAYTIHIKFNEDAFHVYDVRMADPKSFPGQPIVNEAAFTRGELRISSLSSKYSRTPSVPQLKYHVATIYWAKASPSPIRSPLRASIIDLYDLEGRRIDGRLILSPDMIEAPEPHPE